MKKKLFIAIVYASRQGHTKMQAEAVARGAAAAGAKVKLFESATAIKKMSELDAAAAIVIGTPTYMGNISSEIKLFMENCVSRWFSRVWSDKVAGGFTCSASFSGDKVNTMQGICLFALQMGMIWVGENQLAAANLPDEYESIEGPGSKAWNRNNASIGPMASVFHVGIPEAPACGDLETAEAYGRRISEITARLHRDEEFV